MSESKTKTVVLDLDETLIHGLTTNEAIEFLELDKRQKRMFLLQNGKVKSSWIKFKSQNEKLKNFVVHEITNDKKIIFVIIERPNLAVFLTTLNKKYRCLVWTAASMSYALSVVNKVFPDECLKELELVLYDYHCDKSRIFSKERRGLIETSGKDLCLLYSMNPSMNPSNTIIIDDNGDVCKLQCNNTIKVDPFNVMNNKQRDPVFLSKVIIELEKKFSIIDRVTSKYYTFVH